MFKKIFLHYLERRHFWRYVGFDQLGELYTSMMLRSMGLSLIGVFVPIYLYLNGYSLVSVALFMTGLFVVRVFADVLSGYIVAAVGPKHVILQSYLLQILSLLLLLTLPANDWPLWWVAVSWGISLSMFFVAYHVDFSKIIHKDHGGKELGIMTVLERIGAALGPLVGGLIATIYGAEYTIIAAIAFFVVASIPLFITPEPLKNHQKITFKGLQLRKIWRDLVAYQGMAFEASVAVGVWPLYIAIFIATTGTYGAVGLVTTIGVIAAILSAKAVGLVIDRRHGKQLLNISAIMVAIVHLFRPFIGGLGGAALVNTANDAVATGSRLPFVKGMYDRADSLPGFRIAYIVIMEAIADLSKALSWLLPALLFMVVDVQLSFQITFIVSAIFALFLLMQRFPALDRAR